MRGVFISKLDLIREKREVFEKTLVTSREEDFIFGNGIFFPRASVFNKQKLESIKKEVAEALMQLGVNEKEFVSLGSMAGNIELHDLDDIQSLDLFVAVSDACGFIDNSEIIQAINWASLLDASNNSQCIIDPVRCINPMARTLLNDKEMAAGISDVCYKSMLFFVNGDKIEKAALGTDKSANNSDVQKVLNKEYIP